MIIRLQSPEGNKRIECDPYDTTYNLYSKTQLAYNLEDIFGFKIFQDNSYDSLILMHERKYLHDYNLKHGDLLYIRFNPTVNTSTNKNDLPKCHKAFYNISTEIENVDLVLEKSDGLINRKGDHNFCRHGANAQCVNCAPLEPYDETYLKEHNIKHMSFYSYLKKLKRGADKGKFICLEDISCKIKPGCKSHPEWPKGICSKCQPSAITLNSQVYRHVDNVTFENTNLVDNFLDYWRITGNQRVGFLYGYYEAHKDIPLGVRAVVVAIYEPPQESSRDSIKIHMDRLDFKDVDIVANHLGYKRIGWIFTDLVPEENGMVKHIRNSKSYFLTAQECIMAGFFQNCHPNPCKLSKNGFFGSKFVTICVTGDSNNNVHTEAYQVSNQCMALVRDECLVPTFTPELAYVCESNNQRYVPDVFYKEKDKYGNDISKIARPLPIEYLLIDVPVSAPIEQSYTFNPIMGKKPFPVENRLIEKHLQDFYALSTYMNQFDDKRQFLEALSDFHFLIYLLSMDIVNFRDSILELLDAIKKKNSAKALEWASKESWSTIQEMIKINSNESSTPNTSSNNATSNTKWSCMYCTFENDGQKTSCEMCNLPKY